MDSYEMTTEHLARTLALGRHRERLAIAKRLLDKADALLGAGETRAADAVRELATELRAESVAPSASLGQVLDAPFAHADVDQAEAEAGQSLPPVRHHDDFEEGSALARQLLSR